MTTAARRTVMGTPEAQQNLAHLGLDGLLEAVPGAQRMRPHRPGHQAEQARSSVVGVRMDAGSLAAVTC
ncbi:hypothetical protein [Streptomyces cylindrosporus]|uniref:Uncharacterized protein n=1 Tax=Streptomyces cylindrosporus TaxID=2927583 RepID=A0ABS9Y8N4_9ACTN|nr:hypothetical protein [Streptomyces cylindrosporus]MCI3273590.1 hypothetical protein [Streptomyces cylindrosporus]